VTKYETYKEFFPFYLSEHSNSFNRFLHYLGTVLSVTLIAALLVTRQWSYLWLVLIVGYGPAWIGHYIVEKNRPATFNYPLWSIRGDFHMLSLKLRGKLQTYILDK
jgi:hypothetical protein